MTKENTEFKREIAVQWIKGASGNTYLCPSASLDKVDKGDEKSLQTICVDESDNPQND